MRLFPDLKIDISPLTGAYTGQLNGDVSFEVKITNYGFGEATLPMLSGLVTNIINPTIIQAP